MGTFVGARLMQVCLGIQVSVNPGSWRFSRAQKGEQRCFHDLHLSLVYAVFFISKIQTNLPRSMLLALYLLVGTLRPQKYLCGTQLVVGVSPEPGSSQCKFGLAVQNRDVNLY